MRYNINADGSLSQGRVFFDMTTASGEDAIDGVKVDRRGMCTSLVLEGYGSSRPLVSISAPSPRQSTHTTSRGEMTAIACI